MQFEALTTKHEYSCHSNGFEPPTVAFRGVGRQTSRQVVVRAEVLPSGQQVVLDDGAFVLKLTPERARRVLEKTRTGARVSRPRLRGSSSQPREY